MTKLRWFSMVFVFLWMMMMNLAAARVMPRVSITGTIFCDNRCSLLDKLTTPLRGAQVKLQCKDSSTAAEAISMENGVFKLTMDVKQVAGDCVVKLIKSSDSQCSIPTDTGMGLSGAMLSEKAGSAFSGHIYSVGPFAYRPHQSSCKNNNHYSLQYFPIGGIPLLPPLPSLPPIISICPPPPSPLEVTLPPPAPEVVIPPSTSLPPPAPAVVVTPIPVGPPTVAPQPKPPVSRKPPPPSSSKLPPKIGQPSPNIPPLHHANPPPPPPHHSPPSLKSPPYHKPPPPPKHAKYPHPPYSYAPPSPPYSS